MHVHVCNAAKAARLARLDHCVSRWPRFETEDGEPLLREHCEPLSCLPHFVTNGVLRSQSNRPCRSDRQKHPKDRRLLHAAIGNETRDVHFPRRGEVNTLCDFSDLMLKPMVLKDTPSSSAAKSSIFTFRARNSSLKLAAYSRAAKTFASSLTIQWTKFSPIGSPPAFRFWKAVRWWTAPAPWVS